MKNLIFSTNFMGCEIMLQIKVVVFKKLYKFYIVYLLIGIIVFLINIKMLLNSREFKFFKNYRNEKEL